MGGERGLALQLHWQVAWKQVSDHTVTRVQTHITKRLLMSRHKASLPSSLPLWAPPPPTPAETEEKTLVLVASGTRNLPNQYPHRGPFLDPALGSISQSIPVFAYVAQSCLAFGDLMDCSPPGSSVHGIFQPRTLEWVAMSFSRGSSRHRDRTSISCISCIGRQILYHGATWEAPKVY